MGCLNSNESLPHWFGNIHLSGPCNRACYFCIGQFMPALDPLNVLDTFPLPGLEEFLQRCRRRGISAVNLTGSNTDPLLYRHHAELATAIRSSIGPGCSVGIRTNGVAVRPEVWPLYDHASVSITTFDPELYRRTMGLGSPPNLAEILRWFSGKPLKVNVVLCAETVGEDLEQTLDTLRWFGIKTVNLREPYGQPRIGPPKEPPTGYKFGMPWWDRGGMTVTYWDVHYVEVESVNLYASGRVSETYPVTLGCAPDGTVLGQEHCKTSGRKFPQWSYAK